MKKIIISALMTIFIAACGSSKTADIQTGGSQSAAKKVVTAKAILDKMATSTFKDGELLVKFKSGVARKTLMKAHDGAGATVLKSYDIVENLQHVKLPDGMTVQQAVESYMADPDVEYAEPNYVRCASSVNPSDPLFTPQQWALHNTGTFANGTLGADIDVREAWEFTQGNRSDARRQVVVAVIDTGIDYNHPDLVSNIWMNPGELTPVSLRTDGIDNDLNGFIDDWRGWNFVDGNNDPFDDIGHGTHVSGIIGAQGNNNIGVSGVMWNVKIMPLKVFSTLVDKPSVCSTATGFVSDEIAAVQYAWKNGANIINGSYGNGQDFCQAEFDAVAAAEAHGVLFVAAAGNSTRNVDAQIGQPQINDLHNLIVVAATDQNDRLATFSDFGPQSVHIGAPGVYILSTVPTNQPSVFGNDGYDFKDGTSMAAPHVAGVAGLIMSYYNKDVEHFNYRQVRGLILRYVDTWQDFQNLQTLNGWVWSNGRLNAYKALSALLTPSGLSATAAGSTSVTLSWTDNAKGEDFYVIERRAPGGTFSVVKDNVPFNATSFTDTGLTPSTAYEYRVKAMAYLPNPPDTGFITADSFYSNTAAATTTGSGTPGTPVTGDGGGGGCSVGTRKNASTAVADSALILLPLIVLGFIRSIRRRK